MTETPHLHQTTVVETLLEMAQVPTLILDAQGVICDFSQKSLELFPKLQRGQSLREIANPDEGSQLESLVAQSQDTTHTVSQLIHHREADQHFLHMLWKAQKLLDQNQQLRGFCLIGQDQTYSDKLEHELKKSFRLIRYQKMALDESAIVAITDQRGVINYVNDTFCRISGYEREELIGKTHSVLKSGFHPPEFFKDLWKTISSGRVWKGEIRNKTKQGETYWVDTTIVPFLNENGRPYQFVAIRFDVTEKKFIQEKLEKERMRGMYAEKMASLGELAAGIAHELGNPAASIIAWLEVIEAQHERESLDLAMFMQTVPKVRRDAKRMRDIIQGMLTYARDGSRDPFQSEGVQTILQQVVEYCGHKLRKCSVKVTLNVPNPYLTLECRLTEISQMLVNFILNACDAVQDLDEKWVEMMAVEKNGTVEFSITDSGKGIPEDVADRMFQPFFTTKPVGRGTGLGLSIACSIIDNHQGTITLDRLSEHTRFVIAIPRHHAPDQEK